MLQPAREVGLELRLQAAVEQQADGRLRQRGERQHDEEEVPQRRAAQEPGIDQKTIRPEAGPDDRGSAGRPERRAGRTARRAPGRIEHERQRHARRAEPEVLAAPENARRAVLLAHLHAPACAVACAGTTMSSHSHFFTGRSSKRPASSVAAPATKSPSGVVGRPGHGRLGDGAVPRSQRAVHRRHLLRVPGHAAAAATSSATLRMNMKRRSTMTHLRAFGRYAVRLRGQRSCIRLRPTRGLCPGRVRGARDDRSYSALHLSYAAFVASNTPALFDSLRRARAPGAPSRAPPRPLPARARCRQQDERARAAEGGGGRPAAPPPGSGSPFSRNASPSSSSVLARGSSAADDSSASIAPAWSPDLRRALPIW